MNRSYRYTLRLGQRARLRRRLTAGVLATFAVCALAAVSMPVPDQVRVAPAHEPATRLAAAAPAASGKQRPPGFARLPVEAHEPSLELRETSFEEGDGEEDRALVTVAGPELADAGTNTPNAGISFPPVSTAGVSQAVAARAPLDAGGLALPPRTGDLRNMGLLSTGWAGQLDSGSARSGTAIDSATGSAPPMLVAVGTPQQVEEAPAADPDPGSDLDRFLPRPDPSQPPRPDSTLPDASRPADVPEPATGWLMAAALTALLTLRRKD